MPTIIGKNSGREPRTAPDARRGCPPAPSRAGPPARSAVGAGKSIFGAAGSVFCFHEPNWAATVFMSASRAGNLPMRISVGVIRHQILVAKAGQRLRVEFLMLAAVGAMCAYGDEPRHDFRHLLLGQERRLGALRPQGLDAVLLIQADLVLREVGIDRARRPSAPAGFGQVFRQRAARNGQRIRARRSADRPPPSASVSSEICRAVRVLVPSASSDATASASPGDVLGSNFEPGLEVSRAVTSGKRASSTRMTPSTVRQLGLGDRRQLIAGNGRRLRRLGAVHRLRRQGPAPRSRSRLEFASTSLLSLLRARGAGPCGAGWITSIGALVRREILLRRRLDLRRRHGQHGVQLGIDSPGLPSAMAYCASACARVSDSAVRGIRLARICVLMRRVPSRAAAFCSFASSSCTWATICSALNAGLYSRKMATAPGRGSPAACERPSQIASYWMTDCLPLTRSCRGARCRPASGWRRSCSARSSPASAASARDSR